jgi:branched-chain amino acid aminotransferase
LTASDRALWINGRLARGADAALPLSDRGARDGEGLFETLRVEGGRPQNWRRHLERLVVSAAELGFPVPPSPSVLAEGLEAVLAANGLQDAAARITVTRGTPGGRPTRTGYWVEAEPLLARLWRGTRSGQANVVISRQAFLPGHLARHKTTSRIAYHLAREEARVAGADETLLADGDGNLLEGSVSNLFLVVGGEVVTPPIAMGILPGIVRAQVLHLCIRLGIPTRERAIPRAELPQADEVFVTNSIQQVVPLVAVDGQAVPSRTLGARLREIYREHEARGA